MSISQLSWVVSLANPSSRNLILKVDESKYEEMSTLFQPLCSDAMTFVHPVPFHTSTTRDSFPIDPPYIDNHSFCWE